MKSDRLDPLGKNIKPPIGVCQTTKALEAQPSPCLSCSAKMTCVVFAELGNLQRSSPWSTALAVTGCFVTGTKPTDPVTHHGDVGADFAACGVNDLCHRCPAQDCQVRNRRDQLQLLAATSGIYAQLATICCSANPGPARSEAGKLYQIGESAEVHQEFCAIDSPT